jgi:hypothetical protein
VHSEKCVLKIRRRGGCRHDLIEKALTTSLGEESGLFFHGNYASLYLDCCDIFGVHEAHRMLVRSTLTLTLSTSPSTPLEISSDPSANVIKAPFLIACLIPLQRAKREPVKPVLFAASFLWSKPKRFQRTPHDFCGCEQLHATAKLSSEVELLSGSKNSMVQVQKPLNRRRRNPETTLYGLLGPPASPDLPIDAHRGQYKILTKPRTSFWVAMGLRRGSPSPFC